MTLYWIMLLIPAAFLLTFRVGGRSAQTIGLYAYAIALTWFIGLRYLVGCDWYSYETISLRIAAGSFLESFEIIEPGYATLNWLSEKFGLGIYGVNFVCAGIFSYGFVRFAKRQPNPYLFVVAAFPMLVVTVAMGYTRQGAAIGMLMLAFNAFVDRKLLSYLAFVGLATLFHSSAIVFAPAAIFLSKRRLAVPALISLFVVGTVASSLLESRVQGLIALYVTSTVYEGASSAAIYRISLNSVAVLIFLLMIKAWRKTFPDFFFYLVFLGISLLSIAAVPFSAIAADRLALYFLPLQAAVFARVPQLAGGRQGAWPLAMAVVAGFSTLMYVWFRFATHSACWVPYRNLMLPEFF